MEAPEKIYVDKGTDFSEAVFYVKNFKSKESDIEYTRTDAWVKKVCDWLESNYVLFLDSSRLGINIEELVEDLKNDFKTE